MSLAILYGIAILNLAFQFLIARKLLPMVRTVWMLEPVARQDILILAKRMTIFAYWSQLASLAMNAQVLIVVSGAIDPFSAVMGWLGGLILFNGFLVWIARNHRTIVAQYARPPVSTDQAQKRQ